jgi:integrase
MPRERTERIYGPKQHGKRWRVTVVAADGSRSYARESDEGPAGFATEEAALAYIHAFRDAGDERTISTTVAEYLEHRTAIGKRPGTVTTDGYRLRAVLRFHERDRTLLQITTPVARTLFTQRKADLVKKRGKLAYDTAFGELCVVRAFFAWCIKRGWVGRDPFAEIELEGQKVSGKPQLYIDESRRFIETALDEHSREGVAAAMAILMGMRASEITNRVVRDVDDSGRVLWISRAKTPKGNRHLKVPVVLQAPLVELCAGRKATEPLFGEGKDRHWVYYHVHRLCGLAKVPEVCTQGLRGTQSTISIDAVSVEHVAAALGQNGPRITRRAYLAPGAEQSSRARKVEQLIARTA